MKNIYEKLKDKSGFVIQSSLGSKLSNYESSMLDEIAEKIHNKDYIKNTNSTQVYLECLKELGK